MTHSIDNSYIKIWVWKSNEENAQAAPVYGHVALETFHQGSRRYISFCLDPSCKLKPSTPKGYLAHFHQKKEEDDTTQIGKTATAYQLFFLDVSKVNCAFKQFKKNPNAWGSLGWGIFDRVYSFNDCGLTAFLLDKGKIFADPIYQDVITVNSITQRIISGLGLFYSSVNCWVGYKCRAFTQQIIEPTREIFFCATAFKEEAYAISSSLPIINSTILRIERALDVMNQYNLIIGQISRPTEELNQGVEGLSRNLEKLKNIRKFVNNSNTLSTKFATYPWQEKCNVVQKFTDSADRVSKQLFVIAAITLAALGTFWCVNNRIQGWYDARDIVLLAEKAIYVERVHSMKFKQAASYGV